MTCLLHRCSRSAHERRTFGPWCRRFVLGGTALLLGTLACAEPFVPVSDDVVLERVPASPQHRQFKSLRRALAANPHDVAAALDLSRAYLDVGRRTSDPRFLSYAQATLAPFLKQSHPPLDVLIVSGTAMQSSHRFDEALALLEQALAIDARNSQALLTKATVLQVRGEYDAARKTCSRLLTTAEQLVAITCIASVDAMNGKLAVSYEMLARLSANSAGALPRDSRSWLSGQLGEMAVRLGRDPDAERHFKTALVADPNDLYVKGEYADLLLRQRRVREVFALLYEHEAQDALLLRLALAEALGIPVRSRRWRDMYAARYTVARRDDAAHGREQARFELDINGNASAALRLAQSNWQVQREPADVRMLVRAAHAAHDTSALAGIRAWIDAHHYEDATLNADISGGDRT